MTVLSSLRRSDTGGGGRHLHRGRAALRALLCLGSVAGSLTLITSSATASPSTASTPARSGLLGPAPVAPSPPPPTNWVAAENALPGTADWRIPSSARRGIAGFADHVSATVGEHVTLYVDTKASSFRVEAYRLGYYQGLGGRLVWASGSAPAVDQPAPTMAPVTNMVDTSWSPSLDVPIDASWVQGNYLLKLVSGRGGMGYVPLVIRDDTSTAALVVQQEVNTWQAYNHWGGASLYSGPDGTFATRSRVVSFDRPYGGGRGDAGMLTSLPFISLIESQALDVTYWTDVDLHERPDLLQNHSSLVALDHSEYWSTSMRTGAEDARAAGVNLAFFGANAMYRHIRYEGSRIGADRHIVCYKVASEDPLRGIDNAEVTVNWRNPPVRRPESAVLGPQYGCNPVHGDLVVADASAWPFAGTGLSDGDHIPGAVDMENDLIHPDAPTPGTLQILGYSPVTCRHKATHSDMTYYTARSGASVFDAASQGFVKVLRCDPPVAASTCSRAALQIVDNVLWTFGRGPAGLTHPSVPNLGLFGITLLNPTSP